MLQLRDWIDRTLHGYAICEGWPIMRKFFTLLEKNEVLEEYLDLSDGEDISSWPEEMLITWLPQFRHGKINSSNELSMRWSEIDSQWKRMLLGRV